MVETEVLLVFSGIRSSRASSGPAGRVCQAYRRNALQFSARPGQRKEYARCLIEARAA